jgi:flagellar protein FlaJ
LDKVTSHKINKINSSPEILVKNSTIISSKMSAEKMSLEIQSKIISASKKSVIESVVQKKSGMREIAFQKHKTESLKIGGIIGLFAWLVGSVITKNLILGGGIAIIVGAIGFVLILQLPLVEKKKRAIKAEADLPLFLLRLSTETRLGKGLAKALEDCCEQQDNASKEFKIAVEDMKRGLSLKEALQAINERLDNANFRRAISNIINIYSQGKKESEGLKKLAQEMLVRQRIESKEFSGKMVVYALVFIAISAIVPAMFISFILIGSFFMKLSFTGIQVLLIIILGFPTANVLIMSVINSKTPVFLKG